MKPSQNCRKSPIPPQTVSETTAVLKTVERVLESKLITGSTAQADYILLEKDLPATARLLSELSESDRRHALLLGSLRRDQGLPVFPPFSSRAYPYCLLEDADSHAPVVAARILHARLAEKETTSAALRYTLERARGEATRSLLQIILSEDEAQQAALRAQLQRLSCS